MKFLKKFALFGLVAPLLFSLLSFTNALAGGEGETVIIRTYEVAEVGMCKDMAKILITEQGKTKQLPLDRISHKNPENEYKILETINNVLDQYHKQGYKIVSTTYSSACAAVTTYILTK